MLKVEFRDQNLQGRLKSRLDAVVRQLRDQLFDEIRRTTPVDTGTARGGWRKSNNQQGGFVIENQVPYIGILDKGRHMTNRGMRGSRQAPRGIVGPSLKQIKGKN